MKNLLRGKLQYIANDNMLMFKTENKNYKVNFIRISPRKFLHYLGLEVVVKGSIRKDGETLVITKLNCKESVLFKDEIGSNKVNKVNNDQKIGLDIKGDEHVELSIDDFKYAC